MSFRRALGLSILVRRMAALVATPTPVRCGELACQHDTYRRTLTATVVSCVEAAPPPAPAGKKGKKKGAASPAAPQYEAVLSDTVLFPEGGGQPSDSGTVGGVAASCKNVDGVAVHLLEKPVAPGAEVEVVVDWARRWDHACQHSAQHLVTALAVAMNGSPTLSWNLAPSGGSSFLELGAPFDAASHLAELERSVNAAILKGHAVSAEWHSVAAVNGGAVDGLRKSSRALPESVTGPVRVVRYAGIDVNTCCGTHVASTAHLQGVKFTKVERKKASTLVYYVAGPRVFQAFGACLERERAACCALSAGPDTLVPRLEDALEKKAHADRYVRRLTKDVVDLTAAALAAEVAGGAAVVAAHRADPADLGDFGKVLASALEARAPAALLLQTFGEIGGAFLLSSGDAARVDAAKDAVAAALGAKGGGRAGRFQGKCADVRVAPDAVAAATAALAAL